MKSEEIRLMSDEEILNRLNETREELMKFRFQMSSGELTDYTRIRHNRRLVARLQTILKERSIASTAGRKE